MLKSNASRAVLIGLIAIAVLELGITHRFGQIWQLAFTGKSAASSSSSSASSSSVQNPSAASDAAHRGA